MQDWTHFREVFRPEWGSPYSDANYTKEIESNRKELKGVLFVDRVLRAMGITKTKSYPPKGDNGLYSLHQQICNSSHAAHHKLSVLYYLLLDFDYLKLRGCGDCANKFAARFGVPERYQLFMTGLWRMDHEQFSGALEYLAHPSLFPEFSDDILSVLIDKSPDSDFTLALAYYYTVQPVITSSAALTSLFRAMAKTSLTEAFYYARTQPEHTRQILFQQLIDSVLRGSGPDTATRATELVSLPLDSAEEQWFQDYLTVGNGKKLRNAKDTVLMRRVVTGRHAESMNDKNLGSQWSAVLGGFKSGMGGRVA